MALHSLTFWVLLLLRTPSSSCRRSCGASRTPTASARPSATGWLPPREASPSWLTALNLWTASASRGRWKNWRYFLRLRFACVMKWCAVPGGALLSCKSWILRCGAPLSAHLCAAYTEISADCRINAPIWWVRKSSARGREFEHKLARIQGRCHLSLCQVTYATLAAATSFPAEICAKVSVKLCKASNAITVFWKTLVTLNFSAAC